MENIYEVIEWPSREERDGYKKIFNVENLKLVEPKDIREAEGEEKEDLTIYINGARRVNNFVGKIDMMFVCLSHVYNQQPDTYRYVGADNAEVKLLYDTYAEYNAFLVIAYLDKVLKIYEDMYKLRTKRGGRIPRRDIPGKLKNTDAENVANNIHGILRSDQYEFVNCIRNQFAHDTSAFDTGYIAECKWEKGNGGLPRTVTMGLSDGVDTDVFHGNILLLLFELEDLTIAINEHIRSKYIKYMKSPI